MNIFDIKNNKDLYNETLNQGKKFNRYKDRMVEKSYQNNNNLSIIEGFTEGLPEDKDLRRRRRGFECMGIEGFTNNNNNNNNNSNSNKKTTNTKGNNTKGNNNTTTTTSTTSSATSNSETTNEGMTFNTNPENTEETNYTDESQAVLDESKLTDEQKKEIIQLRVQYGFILDKYNKLKDATQKSVENYIARTTDTNPYLNKNIQIGDHYGYVTNKGGVEWYPNKKIYENSAGKNNCPAIEKTESLTDIAWKFFMNIPGAIIPTTPTLSVGKNRFKPGQSCGNEGKNVFVNEVLKNTDASYVGCYRDVPSSTGQIVPIMQSSNSTDGFVSSCSSSYKNDNSNYGAWRAFDQNSSTYWHSSTNTGYLYNSSTGLYEGTSNSSESDIVNTKKNGQQTIKGEWIQIIMPNNKKIKLDSYDLLGRESWCIQRAPNTWYLVGWDEDQWYEIDYQENQYFEEKITKTYTVPQDSYSSHPSGFSAFKIITTKTGNNDQTTGRYCLQIATWNLVGDNRSLTPDSDRSMISTMDSLGYTTYEKCKEYASQNSYKYFGLQDYQTDGTATCLVGSDFSVINKYGETMDGYENKSIWSTGDGRGLYMILMNEGILDVVDSYGSSIYKSGDMFVTVYEDGGFKGKSVKVRIGEYGSMGDIGFADNKMDSIKVPENLSAEIFIKSNFDTSEYPSYLFKPGNYSSFSQIKATNPNSGKTSDFHDNVSSMKVFASDYCYMILEDDGNLCIYKGKSPENNPDKKGLIWCSNTGGKAYGNNEDKKAGNGKYGRNYLKAGDVLNRGEWLGNNNGSAYLMMQEDGYLSLITPGNYNITCEKKNDGYSYGTPWVNSVYELDRIGIPSNMGKVGYINENTELSEYPSSMLKAGLKYTKYENYDSVGNDIKNYQNISVDKCMNLCNSNEDCGGFTFDNRDGVNNCWLKNNNMYPKGQRTYTSGVDMYTRDPTITGGNSSCNKNIEYIDSVTWENYLKTGTEMSAETKCKPEYNTQTQKDVLASLQDQMNVLSQQIQDKSREFMEKNKNVSTQIKKNSDYFNTNTKKYIELSQQKKQTNDSLENILQDSDITVLQENYNFMFWSILTVGTVILTVNMAK